MSSKRKKVLLIGPVLSNSGYGEHARCVVRALISHMDRFDLYIAPTMWGQTSTDTHNTTENRFIMDCIERQQAYEGVYDVSVQVALPNEWKAAASKNIGLTAAVESDRCNPHWIGACNQMDKVIVVSQHAGKSLTNYNYPLRDDAGNDKGVLKMNKAPTVIGYPVKTFPDTDFSKNLDIMDSCLLSVLQATPRKNFPIMVKCFVEEFHDEEVGLVLKMNLVKDSLSDRINLATAVKNMLNTFDPNNTRKCKIHLLHGRLDGDDLHSLYTDERMKGYVTTTHGEGFGLPIYEAAYSGLPVVAPNWSGYLDFLRAPYTNEKSGKTKIRSLFLKTRYDLQPVSEESIMKDIILKEASWAYVDEKHFKKNMRAVISSNALYRKEAAILKDYLHATFTPAQIYDRLVGEILNLFPDEQWESSTDDDDDKAFSIFTGEKENETDTSVVMI